MEVEKETVPDPNEEIIIMDKPIKLRGGQKSDNPKIIHGKTKLLGKGAKTKLSPKPKSKPKPKISNEEMLVNTIVKTYWTQKWKDQLNIMKYSRVGFNKKRSNFRSLCILMNHGMKYHKYLYLNRLFDNMEKLPIKSEVQHDALYGKIKLVNKGNKPKENEDDNIVILEDLTTQKEENNQDNAIKIEEIKIETPELDKKEQEVKEINNDVKIIEAKPKIMKGKRKLINKIDRIKKNMNNIKNEIEINNNNNENKNDKAKIEIEEKKEITIKDNDNQTKEEDLKKKEKENKLLRGKNKEIKEIKEKKDNYNENENKIEDIIINETLKIEEEKENMKEKEKEEKKNVKVASKKFKHSETSLRDTKQMKFIDVLRKKLMDLTGLTDFNFKKQRKSQVLDSQKVKSIYNIINVNDEKIEKKEHGNNNTINNQMKEDEDNKKEQ